MQDIKPSRPQQRRPRPVEQVEVEQPEPVAVSKPHHVTHRKYPTRKLVFWFAGPIIGIIASIVLFAIIQFSITSSGAEMGGVGQTIANTLVFLLGSVCVLLLPVGIIRGCMIIAQYNRAGRLQPTEKSAEKTLAARKGWNWGAFFLTWIWGIANGVPQSLWVWVPIVNFVYPFILGAKGNEWAWEGRDWDSLDQFRSTQRKWAIWGAVIMLPILLLYAIGVAANGGSEG